MKKRSPSSVFKKTVEYFPTFSINILVRNDKGEFLFLKRRNNPAKGLYWVPGGRLDNGETVKDSVRRVLFEETGLRGKLVYLSDKYLEELFDTKDFDKTDWKHYSKGTKCVHYLTTVALVQIKKNGKIILDSQSSGYIWSKKLPHKHPYLKRYFTLIKDQLI